jgi:hypothetical protein
MGHRYYEATGSLKKQLLVAHKEIKAARRKAQRWAKKQGGQAFLFGSSFGRVFVSGVDFGEGQPADVSLWKQVRKKPGWWAPRLTRKEGKALEQEMRNLDWDQGAKTNKILGLKGFEVESLFFTSPGLDVLKSGRVFVSLHAQQKPAKGLRRISDVALEKLRKGK